MMDAQARLKEQQMVVGRNRHHPIPGAVWLWPLIALALATTAGASPGEVLSHQKISDTQGGFTGTLQDLDGFGESVASLGDLDGDGVGDLAVGSRFGGDVTMGAVWVLFLEADGTVKSHQKIGDNQGGFTGTIHDLNGFGTAVASLDDLDGDGVGDMAVGAAYDDEGGLSGGTVWILFLNTDGTVKSHQEINASAYGFTDTLGNGGGFGSSVASLGDLDGDGVGELAVAAPFIDDGAESPGAVWVLFLRANGTVKFHQKISGTYGGFTGTLNGGFGSSVASLGDLDGDGAPDLAVGAIGDDDGGADRGAVWVLFLNTNGTVKSHQKISDTAGGFTGTLDDTDLFGSSLAPLGDLDGDDVADLAVGANLDGDGGTNTGAVWVLFLNTDGTVKSHQKISDTQGGFTGTLDNGDSFGISAVALGDLDGNGVGDLGVGAWNDFDGGPLHGAVWILFLDGVPNECLGAMDGTTCADDGAECTDDVCISEVCEHPWIPTGISCTDDGNACTIDMCNGLGSCEHPDDSTNVCDGTVKAHQKISDTQGDFTGTLDSDDFFGASVVSLGDVDGDGVADLAVGALFDDDGGSDRGAVWVLFLNSDGTVKSHQKISGTQGGFTGTLDGLDRFGFSVASLGDLDGDGVGDLAAGAPSDDDGGTDSGAVWILFLRTDGTVKTHQKISDTLGGFTGTLSSGDFFGISVAALGDLDGDGVGDLAVGAQFDDDGGTNRGAVWVLFLNTDGTVKSHQKISDTQGGFTGTLSSDDRFGFSVAALGDLDGDGVSDLAVGAPFDDDGGPGHGAAWVLFLNVDGTVKSHQKISDTQGGFTGMLDGFFGWSVASVRDLNGDGIGDLAVGEPADDDGGTFHGAVWVLFLNTDGTVNSHQKISDTQGSFTGALHDGDQFGWSVASVRDLNGDGVGDLAVGAPWDDDGGSNKGAVWMLFFDGVPGECYGTLQGTPCTDDGVECTDDVCLSEVCEHPPVPAGTPCADDGVFCNGNAVCVGGSCISSDDPCAGATPVCCETSNSCEAECCGAPEFSSMSGQLSPIGSGSPQSYAVLSPPQAQSDVTLSFTAIADLATFSESIDVIINGTLVGAVFQTVANDCPTGGPDTAQLVVPPGTYNAALAGGDAVIDMVATSDVNPNLCSPPSFITVSIQYVSESGCLDDGNPCTDDTCVGGVCNHPPLLAGTACGDPAGVECDAPDTCDGFGVCLDNIELSGAACSDDGNPCTDDMCDGAGSCQHPNDDTNVCDDDAFCNGPEHCSQGACISQGDPCLDGGECSKTCNEVEDNCFDPAGTLCTDDGNPCTDDVCDGAGFCQHPNDGTNLCDDGVFCNGPEHCSQGACISQGDPCLDGEECSQTCNEVEGNCFDPAGTLCTDDGNPSTTDVCDGAGFCQHPNAGSVKSHQKISDNQGSFTGTLADGDWFSSSVASLGDLDGDGVGDLAVGAKFDDDGGPNHGAVWVLFLNTDGTVKSHQKISDTQGSFTGTLDFLDAFGTSVAALGDLDGDGVGDLAVGAQFDDDGGTNRGAVWVLFLNTDGTVKSHQKISDTQGGFTGVLDYNDRFGSSVASLGDLDGDGVGDLAVGANNDDDGGSARGAVWVLFLNIDGTVKSHQKISDTQGGFAGTLDDGDGFGDSVASLGDLDGDGVGDLAVGAPLDGDGSPGHGAVWVLFLEVDGTVKSHQKISDTQGGFAGTLDDVDWFGFSVAALGDLDSDGASELVVGGTW